MTVDQGRKTFWAEGGVVPDRMEENERAADLWQPHCRLGERAAELREGIKRERDGWRAAREE